MGLSRTTLDAFRRQVERRTGVSMAELSIVGFAPDMAVPLCILHDQDDADVPVDRALSIAARWPGAQLHVTRGLGHSRILHHPVALDKVVAFVGRRADAASSLEQFLFYRDCR
jgi:pimeloyl-ACP methyl ester carboxylesterase